MTSVKKSRVKKKLKSCPHCGATPFRMLRRSEAAAILGSNPDEFSRNWTNAGELLAAAKPHWTGSGEFRFVCTEVEAFALEGRRSVLATRISSLLEFVNRVMAGEIEIPDELREEGEYALKLLRNPQIPDVRALAREISGGAA